MRLVIAAGGTGGHITPGVGIAEYAVAQGLADAILFIGAENGLEGRLVPLAGFDIRQLPVGRVRGMGLATKLTGAASLGIAVPRASRVLREFAADIVLGMGGYASAPAMIAAGLKGIPTVLCEQNTIPGTTNRALSRVARQICVSFAMSSGYLPANKVVLTGNPVRQSIVAARAERQGRSPRNTVHVLVLGGSQGALFLNTRVATVLGEMARKNENLHISHQTGTGRKEEAQSAYGDLVGKQVELLEYIEEMGTLLADVDLVVARAGATTVAELTAVGLPSVLVPFPYATDNHQYWNAMALVRHGAARLVEQDGYVEKSFRNLLEELVDDASTRSNMAAAAAGLGRPDAAQQVVSILRSLSCGN